MILSRLNQFSASRQSFWQARSHWQWLLLVLLFLPCGVMFAQVADEAKLSIAFEKTRLAYQMQKWSDVLTAAGELLAVAPEHLEGHFMLAIAEIRLRQNDAAIRRLTWLNSKVSDSAVFRHSLAEALLAAGLADQALIQAQYAVQLAPAEEKYKKFLQSLSPQTAGVTPSAASATGLLHAVAASGSAQTASGQVTEFVATEAALVAADAPAPRIPSEYEQVILEIDATCTENADREMQLILAAVAEKPEFMADAGWAILQRRLQNPRKDLYSEVLRQFLLWSSGELSIEGYERFVMQSRVKKLDWQGDPLLVKVAERLAQYGITPAYNAEQDTVASGSASWFDSLTQNVREAFFDARYDDAWALHCAGDKTRPDNLWAYQTGRLALELWQLHNFKQEWLVIAQEHLKLCIVGGIWQDDAKILLAEIESILEGKAIK